MPGQVPESAAAVHRRIVELSGAGRQAEALALIDPDAIDHRGGTLGDQIGAAAWKDKWEHMYDGLRDVSVTVEQNVASGDISTNRYTLRRHRRRLGAQLRGHRPGHDPGAERQDR
jgi:hypothetical protein